MSAPKPGQWHADQCVGATFHEHYAPVERAGDPKICAGCGLRRDPVTHAWMTPDDYAALYAERQERRGRFGADRPEGEALARAMNGAGL